jgi:catalase
VEQRHIVAAFRFELTRVQVPAIRMRVVSMLANVAPETGAGRGRRAGHPGAAAQPRALGVQVESEVEASAALSLMARPGEGDIRTRRVALLVCDGVDAVTLRIAYEALARADAVPRFVVRGSAR